MILILSKSQFEVSTEDVMDWLEHKKTNYYRLNGSDFYEEVCIENGHLKFDNFDFSKVKFIWNRRWDDDENLQLTENLDEISNENFLSICSNLKYEKFRLTQYFQLRFSSEKWSTLRTKTSVNKLLVLDLALEMGINIPDYIVTSSKKELSKFITQRKEIIVKPLSEILFLTSYQEKSSSTFVFLVDELKSKYFQSLPEHFHFSFFQEKIEKEFEIRSFYLDSEFFSMAIFSQCDPQTMSDFRNYNTSKPNRTVPYKLPKEIETKLDRLMQLSQLRMGSIDLIKSTDGNYYFLEVNPVGQFGMTSFPCNYNLEKRIANFLIKYAK